MPFCFCEMDAGWAFVVSGSFDPIHVSASWKMLVRKFDDKDLSAVLESGQGLPRAFPVTSQLVDSKVCLDQLFLSMSFLQS